MTWLERCWCWWLTPPWRWRHLVVGSPPSESGPWARSCHTHSLEGRSLHQTVQQHNSYKRLVNGNIKRLTFDKMLLHFKCLHHIPGLMVSNGTNTSVRGRTSEDFGPAAAIGEFAAATVVVLDPVTEATGGGCVATIDTGAGWDAAFTMVTGCVAMDTGCGVIVIATSGVDSGLWEEKGMLDCATEPGVPWVPGVLGAVLEASWFRVFFCWGLWTHHTTRVVNSNN